MAYWIFTEAVLAGKPIEVFGEGRMRRDFTYIDDVVAGVLSVLDNPPPDDVGSRRAAALAAQDLQHREQQERGTHHPDRADRGCMWKASGQTNAAMQQGDVRDTYADISAIKQDVGFAPKTSLEAGIPTFVRWYREYMGR
jgi:UDP-glucuronate 4-epimerase